jgi:hypothetical protein
MNPEFIKDLRENISYDPETGNLCWKIGRNRIPPGTPCGCVKSDGYRAVRFKDKLYLAHRIAWMIQTGSEPKSQIDHINRDRSDNRWSNFREATKSQNACNGSKRKNNTSGLHGVYWDKKNSKWRTSVSLFRRCYGKRFANKLDAFAWAEAKRAELHGEFAVSNKQFNAS